MVRARITVLLLAVVLAGCLGAPPVPFLESLDALPAPGEEMPRWPAAPADARIRYLGSIENERDFDSRRSLWRRLGAWMTGARAKRFVRPAALAIQGSRLAVADPGAGAVHLLDFTNRRWKSITRTSDGWLRSPVGVAFLMDGRLVVADSALGRLFLFDATGAPRGHFTEAVLERPTGLAFDSRRGRLWVAETLAHRVRAFDPLGRDLLRSGGRGTTPGRFNFPTMLATDRHGGLWVNDSLNFRLQHLSQEGQADAAFGISGDRPGDFGRPRGIAVDDQGRVFSVDALLDAVQIFDEAGRLLLVFGGPGRGPGRFWLPADVELGGRSHVFVSDSYNQRVQVFAYHPPEQD